MTGSTRFPFVATDPSQPVASLMPMLPFTLVNGESQISVSGLLDTGSSVNVLPRSAGEQLGFVWDQQRSAITLTGNMAHVPARGIIVTAKIASFPPVRLAFAWAGGDEVRLILGQANFFMEFDVCFFRSLAEFELAPSAESTR